MVEVPYVTGSVRDQLVQSLAESEDPRIDIVVGWVRDELLRAIAQHARMHSPHEGYAVIKEELDELWTEVKGNAGRSAAAGAEARQVGAMACRYLLDICL